MNRQEAAALARAARAAKAPTLSVRFWSKVLINRPDECWPWSAGVRRKNEGYGAFWLNGRHHPASRVAYALAFGEVPKSLHVCHTCDNPMCCNPAHLFAATHKENNNDKIRKSRDAAAERHGLTKLTSAQVQAIREEAAGRRRYGRKAIADKYGISAGYVGEIVRGETRARG